MNFNKKIWEKKAENLKNLTGKSPAVSLPKLRKTDIDLTNFCNEKDILNFFQNPKSNTLKLTPPGLNHRIIAKLKASGNYEGFLDICKHEGLEEYLTKTNINNLRQNFYYWINPIIASIDSKVEKLWVNLRRCKNQANEMFENTTIWHLHACFGTAIFTLKDTVVRAPLLCFACDLIKRESFYQLKKIDEAPIINEIFASFLEHHLDKKVDFNNLFETNKKLDYYISLDKIGHFLSNLFHGRKVLYLNSNNEVSKFWQINKSDKQNFDNSKLIIEKDAICLPINLSGGTLYYDLKEIIRIGEKENADPFLKTQCDDLGILSRENSASLLLKNIGEIFKDNIPIQITPLNLYQKLAIKNGLTNDVVIQGPPGTGKSQVIVNFIANIFNNGKTAIVCTKKRVAMDVILKRLGKKIRPFVLNGYIISQKNEFYKSILEWEENVRLAYDLKTVREPINNTLSKKLVNFNSQYKLAQKCLTKENLNNLTNAFLNTNSSQNRLNYNHLTLYLLNTFIKKKISQKENIFFDDFELFCENEEKLLIQFFHFINTNGKWLRQVKNDELATVLETVRLSLNDKKELTKKISYFVKNGKFSSSYIFHRVPKGFNQSITNDDIELINNLIIVNNHTFSKLVKYSTFHIQRMNEDDFNTYTTKIIANLIKRNLVNNVNNNTFVIEKERKIMQKKEEKQLIANPNYLINQIAQKLANPKYLDLDERRQLNDLFRVAKKKRRPSIDKILNTYKSLLLKLFPIWLAPIELISRLDQPITKDKWDYVIFDEASQVFVEEGLPIVYRGKIKIICGDDKQLKPSAFFKTQKEIEEDDYESQMSENSLLDYFLPLSKKYVLRNHYRSNYASLFLYSNEFYKSHSNKKGLLFADINDKSFSNDAFTCINVNGFFKNGINQKEINEIIKQVTKVYEKYDSILIATMNKKQADAVWEGLYSVNELKHILDFDDSKIKVRNLESVQGDEADLVIVSLTYARENENDYLKMHFGPINMAGGENRLNVLMSRAKQKIIVIKSFNTSDMRVKETSTKGLRKFYDLVAYCDNKNYFLNNDEIEQNAFFDNASLLYTKVYNLLLESFHVPKKILKEKYSIGPLFIDQAITKNKKVKIGIRIDNNAYYSSLGEFALDLDKQAFLETRGYNIYRITGYDWAFKHKDLCMEIQESLNTKAE